MRSLKRKTRKLPEARSENTVSATEATGLLPFLPEEEGEESLREMYSIHKDRRT